MSWKPDDPAGRIIEQWAREAEEMGIVLPGDPGWDERQGDRRLEVDHPTTQKGKQKVKHAMWLDGIVEVIDQHGELVWLFPSGFTASVHDGYSPHPILRELFNPPALEEVRQAYEREDLGPTLLWEIENFLATHVELPEELPPIMVATWVLHTWIHDHTTISPYLAVYGPYGSGKTRLLETLAAVSWRSLHTTGLTPAVLFRITSDAHPTLLVDESEHMAADMASELAAMLNVRYRQGAIVMRCRPRTHEIDYFTAYGPTAIAGTNARRSFVSRAISGTMARTTRQLPLRVDAEWGRVIRARCVAWRMKCMVATVTDDLPIIGIGRTAEIMQPLLQTISLADPARLKELADVCTIQASRREAEERDSLEAEIADALREVEPTDGVITVTDVLDALGWDYDRKHNTLVGHILKRAVGLEPCGRVWRGGRRLSAYKWDAERVERFIRRYVSPKEGCQVVQKDAFSQLDPSGQPLDNLWTTSKGCPQVVPQRDVIRQPLDNLWTTFGQPSGEVVHENIPAEQGKHPPVDNLTTFFGDYNDAPTIDIPNNDSPTNDVPNNDAPTNDIPKRLTSNTEWRPACRTLVVNLKGWKHPWRYPFKDAVLNHLSQRDDFRIICYSDAGAWVVDSDTFWAHADIRPRGMVLAEPQFWAQLGQLKG